MGSPAYRQILRSAFSATTDSRRLAGCDDAGVRVRWGLGVLAFAALLLAPTPALAADGPRLEGAFKVLATITSSDFLDDGYQTHQKYIFKSGCPSGECRRVKLTRVDPVTGPYTTRLHRVRQGVYEGTEGPHPDTTCDGHPNATVTVDFHIVISDAQNGRATKIRGTVVTLRTGCPFNHRNDYRISGHRI
jgi:hypothetical protein